MSAATFPSIIKIISPGNRPAFSAGESLRGEIITKNPSSTVISIPTPSRVPFKLCSNSLVLIFDNED